MLIHKVIIILLFPKVSFILIRVGCTSEDILCLMSPMWRHSDVTKTAFRFRTLELRLSFVSNRQLGGILGWAWDKYYIWSNNLHSDTYRGGIISVVWYAWICFLKLWSVPHHRILWWIYLRHLILHICVTPLFYCVGHNPRCDFHVGWDVSSFFVTDL